MCAACCVSACCICAYCTLHVCILHAGWVRIACCTGPYCTLRGCAPRAAPVHAAWLHTACRGAAQCTLRGCAVPAHTARMHTAHFMAACCTRCGCISQSGQVHAALLRVARSAGARCMLAGCTPPAAGVHARSTVLPSPCTGFSTARVPQDLDAVVVGSGIGGLAAACILAKVGKRVLVLEQHDQAGGCCHTFQERGTEFDVGKEQCALAVRAVCGGACSLHRVGCAKCACSACDVGVGGVCVVHAVFAWGVCAWCMQRLHGGCVCGACSV